MTDDVMTEQWSTTHARAALGEPPAPRAPDRSERVERGGVRIAYEVYDNPGRPTVLLMPTWAVVPSRFWKAQVPYLAHHYRVVTFDGRGSGLSDRPVGAAAYTDAEYVADTLAVLDASGTDRAVVVGLSCAAAWAVALAAGHPDRVSGLVALSPSCGLSVAQPERDRYPWDVRHDTAEGWAAYNRHVWLEGDYPAFLEFFFGQMYSEAHSTKQIEDAVRWGSQIKPATLVDVTAARVGCDGTVCAAVEPLCAQVSCPVLVVHGTDDHVRTQDIGARLAELSGGELVLVEGAGHGMMARQPVLINRLLRQFVDRVAPPAPPAPPARRARTVRRRPRALYLSSPIGLGHARRDLAVAQELKQRRPDLELDWLAQHPVTRVLEAAGERIHPASAFLANESAHVEADAGEHDLHAFQAIRRMDETLVHNFMLFQDVVDADSYDLVIGDEAWELDHFLHENPGLKRYAFAWLTDFVGWLPMPDGGPREAALTADYNAEMIEHRAAYPALRDRSIFVGDPDDVVEADFGPGLPSIRDWTRDNFTFAGYVTGFVPPGEEERARLRTGLGYAEHDRLCVVTVGGSGVGAPLLRRVLDAVPLARRLDPALRFLVVAGPRIDPTSLPCPVGARVVGYQPDLHRVLAAADVAVVQGGLTTCMELTAAGTPFVYVPLRHHFEQNLHVRHRLERYGAGRCLPYEEATQAEVLAAAIVAEAGRSTAYRPVEQTGAARVADLLADLV